MVRDSRITIRFTPQGARTIKKMVKEDGLARSAELIGNAINFYQVRIPARKEDKRIILEDEKGNREWVVPAV